MANKYHNAHEVTKGNPAVDGPYLDDIRADQERAYREFRNRSINEEVEVTEEVEVESVTTTVADAGNPQPTMIQPSLFNENNE